MLLIALIANFLLSPADLFVHAHFILIGYLQYAMAGFVFYGFSLVLLRLVLPPAPWGVIYAVASWLFFLWAFFPTRPTPGMMRRIAGSMEDYLAAQRLGERLHLAAIFIFALIQIAYLWYVVRQLRAGSASPIA